jgi:SAM-dependent methyltransferase
MSNELRFSEDLPQLAAEASSTARRLCGPCQNFHLLWPYLRIAQASGGDVAALTVRITLNRLLSRRGQRILIAGAADTGLLAIVARAARPDTGIVVLDRCQTPLALCERFAQRWSRPIETMQLDLVELSVESGFDVVFAHSLLQFIPADRRVDVLSRLRRSLRPDGRLVIVFRTSARIEGSLLAEYRESYPLHLIESLAAANVALPEPRDAFHRRARAYAEERRAREGAQASRADVEQMLEAAGFSIEDMTSIESSVSMPFRRVNEKIEKRRFLAIAKPVIEPPRSSHSADCLETDTPHG